MKAGFHSIVEAQAGLALRDMTAMMGKV